MPTGVLQRKRLLRRVSTWLATVCLGVLGIAQLEDQIQRALSLSIPEAVFDWTIIVAGTGLAVATTLWLFSLLDASTNDPLYLSTKLNRNEAGALRTFAVGFFGETFASEQKIQSWLEQRKDCVTVVRRIVRRGRRSSEEIRGFYILLPLTRYAVDLFKRKEITGAAFLPEHISRTRKDTYGVYIAAIAASDPQARSSALILLHKDLEEYRAKGVRSILTRPTTGRGRELAVEYDMVPLPGTELEGNSLYEKNSSER